MKRHRLFFTGGLIILLFFASFLWFTSASRAEHRASASQQHHPVIFPTRTQAQHLRTSTPAGPPYGQGDLIYHNGLVQETPHVFLIFWGPTWNNGSGGLTGDGQVVQHYFADVGSTAFENILTQYYDTTVAIVSTLNVAGAWADFATPPSDRTCGGPSIEDAAIQNEVNHAIAVNGWARDSANSTYFVYTPNGYYVTAGADPSFCSDKTYCAYHSFSGVAAVAYAAIPYPIDLTACGGLPTSPNNNIQGDTLVNMSSHEQFEGITDPGGAGWFDATGFSGEIGDKCAYDFSAGATQLSNGGTFEVQTEYSNLTSSCVNTYTPAPRFQLNTSAVALTAIPGTNPGQQGLFLSNRGTATLNWSASSLPSWVSVSPTSGSIAPNRGQMLTLTFTIPGTSKTLTYSTNLTLNDPHAVNAPFVVPISVVFANVSKQWYFAEGYTGGSFSTWLTLENPNSQTATVQVRYLLGSGAPILKQYLLTASSRYTIQVNNEIGPNQNVSMVVTATEPIVAERPMYFTYTALSRPILIPGGSDVLGATQLGQDFDFGYLDTNAGHDTWLTILNQNTSPMTVSVQYFPATGGSPTVRQHTVAASSRGTIFVNSENLAAGSYSALVHLSLPGLVERPLYLQDATGYTGAADVVGVASPQTDWYFAEGYTSSTFHERYILSNPSASNTANVTVTFFRSSGVPVTSTVALQPGQQQIVDANAVLTSNNVNNSAHVNATIPILAERFMSFDYTGYVGNGQSANIPGASDVLGAAALSNLFYFAESYTGGQFGEYLTIENPDLSQTAYVSVTYLPAAGLTPTVVVYTVPPSSRYTVFTNAVMVSQSFSMMVESTVPIMVERPMYFNYYGDTGGTDVIGYQPPGFLPSTGLTVYQGAWDGSIYAIDANNGTLHWRYQTGGVVQSTAAVANGIVYVGSDDSSVYALHTSDGSLVWRYQTGGAVDSSPQVANGIVYVGSKDNYLYALDANTGTLVWRYQMSTSISTASPAVANGVVYFADAAFLYALNASTGAVIWKFQEFGNGTTTPAVANGAVYYCDGNDLLAINASTGSTLWSFHSVLVVRTGVDFCNLPVISNGMVYIGGDDGYAYAFDGSTGSIIWKYNLQGAYPFNVGLGNGIVYVGDSDAILVAIDASTGTHLWTYNPGAVVIGIPAVANGYLYFGNQGGSIFAINASDQGLYWGLNLGTTIDASPTLAP